jgi:hypothetical protein
VSAFFPTSWRGRLIPSDAQPARCVLCGRRPRDGTSEHHLIPRTCHSNRWFRKRHTREEMRRTIPLCRDCHRAIHRLIPDPKELGRHHCPLEDLRAHEQIARFVAWVRKQR